jgi:hypothetical protein
VCPERAAYASTNLNSALELLHGYTQIWPLSTRWYESLSSQAAMHQTAGPELARHDINLDKRVGIYRQFATDERTELYTRRQTPGREQNAGASGTVGPTPMAQSQLDAASTLAQLSGAVVGRVSMPPHHSMQEMSPQQQHQQGPSPDGYTSQMNGAVQGSDGSAHMPQAVHGIFNADHFESDLSAFLTGDVEQNGVNMQFAHYQ